jgi:ribose 5-phosphate isomerase B
MHVSNGAGANRAIENGLTSSSPTPNELQSTSVQKIESSFMRIVVASDHRGFQMKGRILAQVAELGHAAIDLGPATSESVDYPDFGAKGSRAVSEGAADRAILICGSGIGMSIVANKFPGVRAALCHDELTAEMSRRHNDANVLCLSADMLGERLTSRMIEIWLQTNFEGGRHARRVGKISEVEHQVETSHTACTPCE